MDLRSSVQRPLAAGPNPVGRKSVVDFWRKQRAAMVAMKEDGDIPRAIQLFREALALNPAHEDSRYYLANCLAARGDVAVALAELEQLRRLNHQSHRAFQRWGVLTAVSATSQKQLSAAEESLNQALSLNPEETGSLLALGEIALIRGDARAAEQRLEWVCRTNPRAVGGLFLLGYLSWKRGDLQRSRQFLMEAHRARGTEWKPMGSASEGDVRLQMYTNATCLSAGALGKLGRLRRPSQGVQAD